MFLYLHDKHTNSYLINVNTIQGIEEYFDENEKDEFFKKGITIHFKKGEFVSTKGDIEKKEIWSSHVFHGIDMDELFDLLDKKNLILNGLNDEGKL